jgi:fructuronate reductase
MGALPAHVRRPDYDRAAQTSGIVHLGIGAFHRAHQAWYTDAAMSGGDCDWMITGVSLRSQGVADQLNPQDGLYTLTVRSDAAPATQVIGSVRHVLVGGADSAAMIAAIAAPETRIITLTVTEKGYCRSAKGGLDRGTAAAGFYPLLSAALRARRDAGLPGVTLLSCDNLAENGRQLGALVSEWLDGEDSGLATWFMQECTTPCAMVDRIVPATSDTDRADLSARLGMSDEGAVFTEPFSQWVIEDRFAAGRPGWDRVGATLVSDVTSYESAKLRMLNGAHSALAYLGLARGHEFVHQAVADPDILTIVEPLMREEAASTITPAPGQDLAGYADSLFARFRNSALQHRLSQIAMDGTQKIPQRWFATALTREQRGLASPAIAAAFAAWLAHSRGDNGAVDDPKAAELAALWRQGDKAQLITQMMRPENGLFNTALPTSLAAR